MMSDVDDLLKSCNEKIKTNRIYLVIWSFLNNFEGIQGGISFDGLIANALKIRFVLGQGTRK